MAKIISRTITIYTYTFGRFNTATGTVEGLEQVVRPFKLGSREISSHTNAGKFLLSVDESSQLYGMTIEDFVKYAKPVDPSSPISPDKEGGEK